MNNGLMEFLLRSEVAKLPEEKKRLYKFIVDTEDSLAEKADTVDEFQRLLLKHSPFDQAVRHFNLPYKKIVHLMEDIEAELNRKISIRYKKVEWIDYTDHFPQTTIGDSRRRVFLFIN
jgi:hypothetical protein